MLNLVKNQYGFYTFRKCLKGRIIRVSLLTQDEVEAKKSYFKIQDLLLSYPDLDAKETTLLVRSLLEESRISTRRQSRKELLDYLAAKLNPSLTIPIKELLTKYRGEKIRSGSWGLNTTKLSDDHSRVLVELLGNLPAHEIDRSKALLVKECLQKLPAHARKKKAYRAKSLGELLKMDIPKQDLMSVTTINMKLSFYSETCRWAQTNGLMKDNPFEGLQLKDKRSPQSLRSPFSISEINRIFSASRIRDAPVRYKYWLPLMALYTGARINELCQIYLEDFVLIKGVWCLAITDEKAGQSLKTAGSRRIIPLHNDLIALGMLEMVESLKLGSKLRLFPELKLDGGKYSREASKWFSRIKPSLLVGSDSKKCFHSFRHSFVDNLVNVAGLGADPSIKMLLGHQNTDITTGLYGSGCDVSKLNKTIQCLSWQSLGVRIERREDLVKDRLSINRSHR